MLKDVSSYGSYLRLLRETFYLGPDRLSKTHKRRERPKRGPSTRLPELTTSEEGKAVSSLETESYSYPSLTNSCFIFIILRGSHSDSPAILTCLPYLFPPGPTCLKPPMAFLCPEVLRLTQLVHEVSSAVPPIPPHSRTLGPPDSRLGPVLPSDSPRTVTDCSFRSGFTVILLDLPSHSCRL